ncbi:uncharacterized protein LOC100264786 isoform X2 [Vitis vinifera]|uniref:uncharacterized protein LOC100264786 isoform X2 n=1 Tax=Vitis vinifera TaxID=29760 RepID=UPI00053FBBB1|nr:uncharacterized protein LOC100264786 isoform X2 [Vitis vinifera]XP_059593825.1 uncharacterized protein LOC100264786 isoform X2 [Vitis vinifera]XP_059593826.1 uncharacterized protein LOC100264786 isoform X2 [Vitis vinifera]|eukprot:XP_010652133.1 PREDICTED: uncharacterized protein LOC100264786 isoform X2 [Vitis vinifera]
MGFKAVYRALQDVFPQVDARLLKAVAIEHSKDADAAVEFVLHDVLPFMSQHPGSSGSCYENQLLEDSSSGMVEGEEESIPTDHQHVVEEAKAANVDLSTKSGSVADENPNDDEAMDGSTALDFYDANDGHDEVYENTESEELIPLEQGQDISSKVGPGRISNVIAITPLHADDGCGDLELALEKYKTKDLTLSQDFGDSGVTNSKDLDLQDTSVNASSVTSNASMHGDGIISSLNDQHADSDSFNGPVACDFDTVTHKKGQEASGLDGIQVEMIQVPDTDAPERLLQAEIDSISCITHCEKEESSVSFDHDAKQEDAFDIEMVGDVVEPVLNTIVTQSGHICSTDFLEEMIEDAKNNKKTLFSSMDSVMNIMREVELQEKAAQQAREEAARGGLEILTRVEELKEMLQHAKEANGMHAGEVYGEKAILATEARELQSRLLSLSDERDKSLKILDEMRHALEARLAAAEEDIKAAEQVKFEKEESARKALAEQEAIMEKVVQESMMLKQEAEENSKLQEFLMDRGHIVDMLQGEISVICQDVKFLKVKFDDRVPLSQSLSSSQTSCKLASSSSSLKSMSSDPVPVPALADESETPKQASPTASVGGQSPKKSPESGVRDDDKALLDDGWDLFENDVDI